LRLQWANRARDILSGIPPLAGPPVNTPNEAGKGRMVPQSFMQSRPVPPRLASLRQS
jgi:hypothetical protein